MTFALERRTGQVLAGAALGTCAALLAVTPSLAIRATACAALLAIPVLWWMLRDASRWLSLFFVSALVLPPLPVVLGNSGPHVALFFAACGLLIAIVYRVRVVSDNVAVSLCALFIAIAASVAMAAICSGPEIAIASLARVMLFGISVFVFFFARSVVPFGIVRVLFWAAAASAVFACLDFYFQFPAPSGFGPQFIWLDSGVFRRAQGVFYEASTLGNLCAFFLEMIAVALFLPRTERPFSVLPMLIGGVALASALVLSYSRASLINLAVALVVLLWLHRKRIRLSRFLVASSALGGAAFALLTGLFPIFARVYLLRISQSFSFFFESPNAILSGRVQTWTVLFQFLRAHPWYTIFGIGYKTLPYSDFIGQTAIADNTYLSMLIETGIAGFAALMIWNIVVLRASYRAANSEDPRRSFCGTWMLCFWAGQIVQMFSADLLTYWRVLPVYMCVFALAVRRR
jgi:O-antigen ligase